mmetsp:Transcript_22489/g.27721  ORF Transcript_22489/g.27721 Transcript_22489/m.27721 type:complete len:395 (+) Transcript_22489:99-1283(+)|eukprot:CAMPEP_0172487954 /NCGR_PEP_ID=MMETSP1066-20121228/17265_1 /TAXON_ID=671091 /ORGANISM="Coscinodiscus wailesii, Strain CCMP2513" /LENGTH=394 /DNA_ID=CAMNT_0013254885 /DNA_START=95 /DNA_END=1279 /DNA_ORIENTATION=-
MSSSKHGSSKDDSPLPDGWTRGYSKSQKRHFYCHAATKTSQWHPPTPEETADPAGAKKRAEMRAKEERSKSSSSGRDRDRDRKRERSSLGSIVSSNVSLKKSRSGGGDRGKSHGGARKSSSSGVDAELALADKTNVAIIVPFRDLHPEQQRSKHLEEFVPHMNKFLQRQMDANVLSGYHIYIVNQSDDGRKFNRGKLLNIGFDYAKKHNKNHDVFIFHDVDLLPGDDLASWYSRFPKTPIHIARVWGRYSNNPKYFGGIVSFSASDMKRINGYPNTFWGWGGEDDEMQKRCEKLRIKWEYPPKGTVTDLEQMSIKEKLDFLRSNKAWKCQAKWECLDEHNDTWKTNGLSNLTYTIMDKAVIDDSNNNATMLTVDCKLNGDHWSNDKCALDFIGY